MASMLTDIFAYRYLDKPIWNTFDENSRRLLVQGFRMVSEQLFPYYTSGGRVISGAEETWNEMNKALAMELGLQDLSPLVLGFYNPQKQWVGHTYNKLDVCKNFVCAEFAGKENADQFIKERLSFIEIAFRRKEEEIACMNAELPQAISRAEVHSLISSNRRSALHLPGDAVEAVKAKNKRLNDEFKALCDELNQRFKQARANLHYHNGYIQIAEDQLTTSEVEQPFWTLVKDPIWKNVDNDMKQAIDLRDSSGRDPAWYAAKALESTIKIISDEKGWTRGNEKGAANYIDNLRSKNNGEFINEWEKKSLLDFFSAVRNPFGHGSGSDKMPSLSQPQTNWAIEFCMIWIKNLIIRM